MSFKHIILQIDGALATITINREKVLNALNEATIRELKQVFEEIADNPEVRGVTLTGAGEKSFIAGADINEFSSLTPAKARDLAGLGQKVTRLMEQLSSPIVAAVNGYCFGGGFEFALACDFILASDNALLGLPEVSLGLIPGWGGTQRLARLIGPNRARQMIYAAEKLTAPKALEWGIVNAVYPRDELLGKAKELLMKISQNSPFAVAQAKHSLNEGGQVDLDRGLILEQTYFGLCFSSADLKEGVAAFTQKRKPDFKGR